MAVRITPAQARKMGLNAKHHNKEVTPVVAAPASSWSSAQVTLRPALVWNTQTAKYETKPVRFGSGAESRRYADLEVLARAGEIRQLVPHMEFDLEIANPHRGKGRPQRYTSDAAYYERDGSGWKLVVEDVKGRISRDYPIRKLMVATLYGIAIREVPSDMYADERSKPRGGRKKR